MALIVTAPTRYPSALYKVYLAGAIDMGRASNWQQEVINHLKDLKDMAILNPRRIEFSPGDEFEQIEWELHSMEEAQLILMWFPKDSEAPVSLLEFGLYVRSEKLIVGVQRGYFREHNVRLTAARYGKEVRESLDILCHDARLRYLSISS